MSTRKDYGTKSINGIDFTDYWNLAMHPLYFTLDKKCKKYIRYCEHPTNGHIKITSLIALESYLGNNSWCYDGKKWKTISIEIQAAINIPYSTVTKQ